MTLPYCPNCAAEPHSLSDGGWYCCNECNCQWNEARRSPDARGEVSGGTPIVCPCCQRQDIKQDANYLYHWECKTCAYQWDVTLEDRP